jgi:hypothetical protein
VDTSRTRRVCKASLPSTWQDLSRRSIYQYATEKGADHPFAIETLASLRAPGLTMPPFNRPQPLKFEWDAPENPEHTAELRADIEVMARLWRNREASWHARPWPLGDQPIPRWLWKRLYKLRIRYHSLEDTLHIQGLSGYREPYTEDAGNDHWPTHTDY